jgi:Flp pilus assembly protein CpaB
MRAMTINVDATSAVEGWARPGTIVDVLLVTKERTAVVAEKVKILSAERSVAPGDSATSNVPSTVTLLTTQEQTLAINTAIPLGKIAFALRSARDDADWGSTIFTPQQLKGDGGAEAARDAVTGYVAIRDGGETRGYALSDGKWIESAVMPQGFLLPQGDGSSDRNTRAQLVAPTSDAEGAR